eukprot:TRINITY_DN1981_c0_g1_i2.p1 TRINITY_DN1981_c0_g1~~TRINITY_DN1981_c0_g1_i2.p1  ORF type:complete len:263 (+),score=20.54 TRINITY_DN1981_c0_g1_i2:201-989(+)
MGEDQRHFEDDDHDTRHHEAIDESLDDGNRDWCQITSRDGPRESGRNRVDSDTGLQKCNLLIIKVADKLGNQIGPGTKKQASTLAQHYFRAQKNMRGKKMKTLAAAILYTAATHYPPGVPLRVNEFAVLVEEDFRQINRYRTRLRKALETQGVQLPNPVRDFLSRYIQDLHIPWKYKGIMDHLLDRVKFFGVAGSKGDAVVSATIVWMVIERFKLQKRSSKPYTLADVQKVSHTAESTIKACYHADLQSMEDKLWEGHPEVQ